MNRRDQVFPLATETRVPDGAHNVVNWYEGLVARDYIAIKAMQGLIISDINDCWSEGRIAELAYKQADAMLKESEK